MARIEAHLQTIARRLERLAASALEDPHDRERLAVAGGLLGEARDALARGDRQAGEELAHKVELILASLERS